MAHVDLAGQVALVTGGSLGIGRSVAVALAQAGASVAINYRSHHAEAEQVAQAVRQAGGRALLVPGDVADYGTVEQIVARTAEEFGRLDMAVSNAVYSDREIFYEANLDGFRRTIDVTMWGAFHLLRAATRQMIRQGDGGAIVVVSSPHAYIPAPRAMPYNMAKAAVEQMARTAAIEVAQHRIRVNIFQPGWTDTPGERKFFSEDALASGGAKIPLGRLGQPDEMARGILFLLDPKNDYVTGSALLIDGGITLPWWASGGSAAPR